MRLIFIFLFLLTTAAYAQRDTLSNFDEIAWHKKAANDYAKGGVILQFAGSALGSYLIVNNLNENKNAMLLPAGLFLAGFVLEGISINHSVKAKNRAGKLSLSLKNGCGLILTFN